MAFIDPDREIGAAERAFGRACNVLRRIAILPAERRAALEEARLRKEDEAIQMVCTSDVVRRYWLPHAALSLSPRLVDAFAPGPANAIPIEWKELPWRDVALHATPDHIEALRGAGAQLDGLHEMLLKTAFMPSGIALHPFMERHVETVWSAQDPLADLSSAHIADHAGFLSRYLARAARCQQKTLNFWMSRYVRLKRGRNMLILGIFDISQQSGDPQADAFARTLAAQSSHRRMMAEAWKRDPEALLRDRSALDWAETNFKPIWR